MANGDDFMPKECFFTKGVGRHPQKLMSFELALRDAGISDIAFYNYGHLRRSNLAWIADALAVFRNAQC